MPNNNITPQQVRKENFKMALQVWLRSILSVVLSFFVYMSITVLVTGLFSEDIGYRIYETTSSGERVLIEEHLYADDSSAAPAVSSETPVGPDLPGGQENASAVSDTSSAATRETLPEGQFRETIRSDPPAAASIAGDVIASICMLLLTAAFPYSIVWSKGDRDKNSVNFGHMQEDKLRGLKVGLMAGIPGALAYIVLILSKLGVFFPGYIFVYRFMNTPFLPIINALTRGVSTTPEVSWTAILVMLIVVAFVPLVCHFGYVLGYKQISLSEKFIYVNPNKKKRRRR